MSGIEAVGLFLGAMPTRKGTAYQKSYKDRLAVATRSYREQRLGCFVRFLSWTIGFDTDAVQELQRNINTWADHEMLAWKASYFDSCNAIAVAGAIFASIGITALTIPNIDDIQWSVRALLTSSTVFGILTVVSATSLHRHIGLANKPLDLRPWLSRGRVPLQHRHGGTKIYPHPYDGYLLDSSVSAMLITQFPRVLLNIAVFLYLVGFGLYALFAWLEDVPDLSHNYRNIFIVFIISLGCCAVYILMCGLSKILDEKTLGDDFHFQRLGVKLKPEDKAELDKLGRKTDSVNAGVADSSTELLHAIDALAAEITHLREVVAANHQQKDSEEGSGNSSTRPPS